MNRVTTRTVALDDLSPNPWNPNEMDERMFQKELSSLRKFGYVNPIVCRELKGKTLQIVDGEQRWKAMRRLGWTGTYEVVVIKGLGDAEAKQLTIILNETRGRADPAKLGDLLTDLLKTEVKSDLLDVLPYSPPVFDKLAGLDDFDWGSIEQPDAPKGTWVERTYRMPREAAEVIDDGIARVREQEVNISDWQALELMAADYLGK